MKTSNVGILTTASGKKLNWGAALSQTSFTLAPCSEQTVLLRVDIDCGAFGNQNPRGKTTAKKDDRLADVDRCEVAYVSVSAAGCLARPVLVAIAVLPSDCDSYDASCSCNCC